MSSPPSLRVPGCPEPNGAQPSEMMEITEPAILSNLNDSLDIFNILKNEERCSRVSCFNSENLFPWFARSIDLTLQQPPAATENMMSFVQSYNEVDRDRIRHRLPEPIAITRVDSSHEIAEQEAEVEIEVETSKAAERPRNEEHTFENLRMLLPANMRDIVTELPNEYLRAMEGCQDAP